MKQASRAGKLTRGLLWSSSMAYLQERSVSYVGWEIGRNYRFAANQGSSKRTPLVHLQPEPCWVRVGAGPRFYLFFIYLFSQIKQTIENCHPRPPAMPSLQGLPGDGVLRGTLSRRRNNGQRFR